MARFPSSSTTARSALATRTRLARAARGWSREISRPAMSGARSTFGDCGAGRVFAGKMDSAYVLCRDGLHAIDTATWADRRTYAFSASAGPVGLVRSAFLVGVTSDLSVLSLDLQTGVTTSIGKGGPHGSSQAWGRLAVAPNGETVWVVAKRSGGFDRVRSRHAHPPRPRDPEPHRHSGRRFARRWVSRGACRLRGRKSNTVDRWRPRSLVAPGIARVLADLRSARLKELRAVPLVGRVRDGLKRRP